MKWSLFGPLQERGTLGITDIICRHLPPILSGKHGFLTVTEPGTIDQHSAKNFT